MATLSLFYGILITMRPEEGERHKKPHLHAWSDWYCSQEEDCLRYIEVL